MTNCDSPFSIWTPSLSPRKPVQYQCNNTSSGRIGDRVQSNSKTPFPLDKPPSYTCNSPKSSTDSIVHDSNTKKEPCCQHAQVKTSTVRGPGGGGFKAVTHKHKVIPIKSLAKPKEGLITRATKYGKTCNDCKKYEADKAKPIEKLIADTRKNAKQCAECECHAKEKKATGHARSKKKQIALDPPNPPTLAVADNCCSENCVGKRVYCTKPPPKLASSKKSPIPNAVRLMDWPWYWSRYYPTAASRVAKRIIQAKIDAHNAKLHPQPVAEFEVCFFPLPPKPAKVPVENIGEKPPERCTLGEIHPKKTL